MFIAEKSQKKKLFSGYAPDTDSEAGTLTTNSPTDWTEKHQLSGQTVAAHSDVKAKGLGLMKRQPSGRNA